jgi:zinc protease
MVARRFTRTTRRQERISSSRDAFAIAASGSLDGQESASLTPPGARSASRDAETRSSREDGDQGLFDLPRQSSPQNRPRASDDEEARARRTSCTSSEADAGSAKLSARYEVSSIHPMRFVPLALALALSVVAAACGPAATPVVTPTPVPSASTAPVGDVAPDPPLPLDVRVRTGKLPSGLTYYILPHKKPEKRAQIWLAVNAGSVLEDDDQRGLAHFVEHMGFNGTTRFPKQALVDMLEKSGVSFGADLNAYTSFDETVYTLTVPTDQGDLLDRAIGVLRDWSDSVTFDPTEVEKERGVVLEEWRLGRGAAMRLFDKEAPVLFHGSKYADRITIGKPEIIRGAPREALVRFYKDWYRPDLMAVVAVGDFSADDVEAKIKAEFGSQKAPVSPRPRPSVSVPPHTQQLVSIETDPEATTTTVSVISEMAHRPEASARDYRRIITEQLFNAMLNARLDEIRHKPDAPFLYAGSRSGGFVRTEDAFSQVATVKEGAVKEGLSAIVEEMLRVERHGFVASELERAKSDVLRQFEESVKQHDTEDGRAFAREIVRNFLAHEAMPGPETELALAKTYLPTITLDELNVLGKSLGEGSRVVTVTGPATMTKPTEASIVATMNDVAARDIKPYEDGGPSAPLIATLPTPGPVVATRTIAELGVTEWTLKNGVHVVVKPTDFKNDEVRMTAFAPGGTSLTPDADYDSAKFASTVVAQGGLGSFDVTALRKALAGKVVGVSAYIGELEEGVTGTASPSDLDSMFQLVYLSFTAPRKDANAFEAWRAREVEAARNRRLSPETSFYEDLSLFSTQNHRRRQPTTPESLAKIDLDKAIAIYKERFADASGFTFVFVGNLDLDRTKTLAETYLGSLPATHHKETWKDVNVTRPRGVAKKAIAKGSEPKARVVLTFHGKEAWSRDTDNDMRMLGEVLRIRLRELLREDMGGVYGVSVSGNVSRRPKQEFTFSVSFSCAPDNIDKLEKAVFDEIKAIQTNGIGVDYLAKVKELRRRAHETNLKENAYWLRELGGAYTYGDDPKLILDFNPMVDKISSDEVRRAAKKYLTSTQYILGELRPEHTP